MDAQKSKKIAKVLTILWLTVFLLTSLVMGIYYWGTLITTGESPISYFSAYHIIVTLFVAFFSIPLLFAIRFFSKAAKTKGLLIFTFILLFHHFLWLTMNIITMLNTINA